MRRTILGEALNRLSVREEVRNSAVNTGSDTQYVYNSSLFPNSLKLAHNTP